MKTPVARKTDESAKAADPVAPLPFVSSSEVIDKIHHAQELIESLKPATSVLPESLRCAVETLDEVIGLLPGWLFVAPEKMSVSEPVSPLAQSLLDANAKSKRFLVELEEGAKALGHKSADDNPGMRFSKAATLALIRGTEKALSSGDVVAMSQAAVAHGIGT